MDSNDVQPGMIITFYSYKGGTGRSMAVANVAYLMAHQDTSPSQRVLVIDWDLEARPAQVLHPLGAARAQRTPRDYQLFPCAAAVAE